jgi:hypothetical protein
VRASTSPAPHSPRLGAGLIRRQPGSAGFLLILMRVQLCLWLAAGYGRLQATASSHRVPYKKKSKFLMGGFVRSPAYNKLKTPTKAGGKAFCTQRLSASKKANFGWGQNLPFCQTPQKLKYFKRAGENIVSFGYRLSFIFCFGARILFNASLRSSNLSSCCSFCDSISHGSSNFISFPVALFR